MKIHAAPVEFTFFVISTAVLAISLWTLLEAKKDLDALESRKVNGPRRATAEANIQESWFGVCCGLIMLGAGVLTLFLKPPPPPIPAQTLVLLVAFVAIGILIVTTGLSSKSSRRRRMRMSPVEHTETTSVTPPPDQKPPETQS